MGSIVGLIGRSIKWPGSKANAWRLLFDKLSFDQLAFRKRDPSFPLPGAPDRASAAAELPRARGVPAFPRGDGQCRQRYIVELGAEPGFCCRLVSSSSESGAIILQIELSENGAWRPVLSYEISERCSARYEFTRGGGRRTFKIDLPPRAVQELAVNDLSSNWRDCCRRYSGS